MTNLRKIITKPKNFVPVIILLVALVIPAIVAQQYIIGILITAMLFMYYASAWNIIGGYAGQFALGNAVFIGIGGYTTAICFTYENISPWISMFIGAFISVVFAIIISLPSFRLTGTYFALASIAFLQIANLIMMGSDTFLGWKTNGGKRLQIPWEGGLEWMQFKDKRGYYFVILGLLVVAILISAYIKRSKTGMYLAAIQTNQGAASTIGVNVVKYKMIAQAVSAVLLSMGGSFYVVYITFADPKTILGLTLSMNIMMYSVIGGLGSVWGPIVGAGVLTFLNEFLRVNVGSEVALLSTVIYGVILMLVVLFSPGGIVGIFQTLWAKLKNKKSKTPGPPKPEEVV